MEINTIDLMIVFDKGSPLTNEEQGFYWFRTSRHDGIIVSLLVSIYENTASLSIYKDKETSLAGLIFQECQRIKVLDIERKCLEILHANGRCFITLLSNPIFDYTT